MKAKKILICLLVTIMLVFSSCAAQEPQTNSQLFDYIVEAWKNSEADKLYDYADEEMKKIMGADDFAHLFDSLSFIGGNLNGVSQKEITSADGTDTYSTVLDFENISVDLSVGLKNTKICSFVRNVSFKKAFEINREQKVTEKYFVLSNDGYDLNAVYTYVSDGKEHPAVLLIAGSGPNDYNETIGALAPFEDIAIGLAQNGINSLRIDKRTLNYADSFKQTAGVDEEYLSDCAAALKFLKKQNISNVYLLGHSLGGQMASEIAADDSEIDGMILFNSTPRHLADVLLDQYTIADAASAEVYRGYTAAAKQASDKDAQGYYYYGATDYYWNSYNKLNVTENINRSGKRTLIINSKYDNQIFDSDINMWNSQFGDNENVTLKIYNDISHFGYKINTSDISSLYKRTDFPQELIDDFSDFCK